MRPLIDINVLLDHYLGRAQWQVEADAILRACRNGYLRAVIAAHTLTTVYHLVESQLGQAMALATVDECLQVFEIAPVDGDTLRLARGLAGRDFEDDVQIASALEGAASSIVTRDASGGFWNSPVAVESPADFVARLQLP